MAGQHHGWHEIMQYEMAQNRSVWNMTIRPAQYYMEEA